MLETVGMFHITEGRNTSQAFVLFPNKSIQWFGGKAAPRDVPVCGFKGELCIKKPRFTLGESCDVNGSETKLALKWFTEICTNITCASVKITTLVTCASVKITTLVTCASVKITTMVTCAPLDEFGHVR